MLWNGHTLTAALRCPVPSEAYPPIRASFVAQTTVFWNFYCNTCLAFLTKSPVAVYFLCAKPGSDVPILRRYQFFASFTDLSEEPIALPSISGRCKICVFRNFYFLTKISNTLESMVAYPTWTIGTAGQMRIFRCVCSLTRSVLVFEAFVTDRSISIACDLGGKLRSGEQHQECRDQTKNAARKHDE